MFFASIKLERSVEKFVMWAPPGFYFDRNSAYVYWKRCLFGMEVSFVQKISVLIT